MIKSKYFPLRIMAFMIILWMFSMGSVYPMNRVQAAVTPSGERLQYHNVYGVFIGVDKFKYLRSRIPIITQKRKKNSDKQLYQAFLARGMLKNHSALLIDEQAEMNSIKQNIIQVLKKTVPGSTFVFYYAGYLSGSNQQSFMECYDSKPNNEFNVDFISDAIKQYFKGDKVIVFADGEKSHLLIQIAKKAAEFGKKAVALTSVEQSNAEITNWMFSTALADTVNGNPYADINNDRVITLAEFVYEVYNITKYFNYQKIGYYNSGVPEGYVMTNTVGNIPVTPPGSPFKIGEYVLHGSSVMRVKRIYSGRVELEIYIENYKKVNRVISRSCKPLIFPQYKVGTIVEVELNHSWYPVKILKYQDDFYYIRYGGRSESMNEWVMYHRIQKVRFQSNLYVRYQDKYYAAKIIKKEGDRYYITYPGYGQDWNEWVTRDRMIIFE